MRLLLLSVLLNGCSFVAHAQNNFFTIGPAIGINQFLSKPDFISSPTMIVPATVVYKAGLMYGIQGAYSARQLLMDVRLLTTKRVYNVNGQSPPVGLGSITIRLPVRVEVEGRYFSMPLTLSYLTKTVNNIGCSRNYLQLFVGAGVVPEWISGSFIRNSYDIFGSGNVLGLDPEKPLKRFSLGGSLQVTGRYSLSSRFVLQVQPALHYFRSIPTPFAATKNSSFNVSASVGYKL